MILQVPLTGEYWTSFIETEPQDKHQATLLLLVSNSKLDKASTPNDRGKMPRMAVWYTRARFAGWNPDETDWDVDSME